MGKIRRKISNGDKKTLPFSTKDLHKSVDKSKSVLNKVSSISGTGGRISKNKSKNKNKKQKSKAKLSTKFPVPVISINDADVYNQILKSTKIQSKLTNDNEDDKELNSGEPGSSVWKKVKTKLRSKKDRQLVKREAFHKKIELLHSAQKEQIAKSNREKTVIVRDMKPILDALDDLITIDEPLSEIAIKKPKGQPQPRQSKKLSMKKRQLDINQGLQYFGNAENK